MRPIRVIPWRDCVYDLLHVQQDKNRFAVRLLVKADEGLMAETTKILPIADLETTDTVASRIVDECVEMSLERQYLYKGNRYYIMAECVFDKRDPQWKRTWAPNANIIFSLSMRGDRIFRCHEKGLATALTKWRSNFYMADQALLVPAQIFCRSPSDSVDIVCKSLTAKPNCILGNIDLSEATVMSPETVDKDGQSSKFLQLSYLLSAPASVKPDQKFKVTVTALDGYGNPTTDVNYDGFVVEAVDGYVPHRRCTLTNGVGTFDAIALGLEDGEAMRIKFGRKFGTGLGECIVSIKS